jgi:hypothetical protein
VPSPCCAPLRCTSFQSTLPAKGATGQADRKVQISPCILISIHAPREGSDVPMTVATMADNLALVSIHAPREGSDTWRADILIASVHGQRVSIHAPREGSDRMGSPLTAATFGFQSTLPAKGATVQVLALGYLLCVSIHAPREGSDFMKNGTPAAAHWCFNPRSPRRERLWAPAAPLRV